MQRLESGKRKGCGTPNQAETGGLAALDFIVKSFVFVMNVVWVVSQGKMKRRKILAWRNGNKNLQCCKRLTVSQTTRV